MADLLPPVAARPAAAPPSGRRRRAAAPEQAGADGNGPAGLAAPAGLGLLSLAAGVAAVALSVLLPVAGTILSLAVITLLRAADRAQSRLAERRSLRGARPSDIVIVIVTAPWTVVRAALTTVLLAPLAIIVALPAAVASVDLHQDGDAAGRAAAGRRAPPSRSTASARGRSRRAGSCAG